MYDQDSDVIQWGLRLLEGDPPFYSGYYGDINQTDHCYQYVSRDHYDISDCSHIENDEIIARTLQEEFSQLAVTEASGYSSTVGEDHPQASLHPYHWHSTSTRNYCSGM